jgi:molybdenum cofactor synthesis domain-containing protein
MNATAGVIIIGDEILTGKVQDANSSFLARELWKRGVLIGRISVIPDEIGSIAREVREFADRFEHVFTSGGIGPTHDDVTISGICEGFGVDMSVSPEIRRFLEQHYGELSPEQLKMAMAPEGADVLVDGVAFPLVTFRNVVILPGIPEYLQKNFLAIADRFSGPSLYLKRIYLNGRESSIAPVLNEVVAVHPDVKLGSYPVIGRPDYQVMVTLESIDRVCLEEAMTDLLGKLSADRIVGKE